MRPLDRQYRKMSGFLDKHPDAKIFLDFVPYTAEKLALGSDVALDILFNKNVTKMKPDATYIYDGTSFRKNSLLCANLPQNHRGDFTVEWMYLHFRHRTPAKEVFVVGSEDILPAISLTPDSAVKVTMRDLNTGARIGQKISYPYYRNPGEWVSMIVEKSGNTLCFVYNGKLERKIGLKSCYQPWQRDGLDLLGGYYKGAADVIFVGNLFIEGGAAKYHCEKYKPGDALDVNRKAPW
jgi:hypothetical protein